MALEDDVALEDIALERVASHEAPRALGRTGRRGRGTAPLAACLAIALGVSTLGACDDDGRNSERWERGRGRRGDDDRGRRERWDRERDRPRAPDAVDGGERSDAGSRDAGADAGSGDVDGELDGERDAGAGAASAALDAGAAAAVDAGDAAVLALSDGQILAVADALLAGEIEHARAAEALLGDPDVIAFAAETSAEREAARSTLTSLATAIGIDAEPSSLADDVTSGNATRLESLAGPDAGSIDAAFLSASEDAHARALERFAALRGAADAPALQAQLLVLEALERSALERSRELAANL